jgi:hypothetical protein
MSDPVSGGNTEDLIFICLRVHTPHEKHMICSDKVVSAASDPGADHDSIQLTLVESSHDCESGFVVGLVSQYGLASQHSDLEL